MIITPDRLAYFPYGQQHPYVHQQDGVCTLVLRTDGDPRLLLPAVRKMHENLLGTSMSENSLLATERVIAR
jgi:hypothetical protein